MTTLERPSEGENNRNDLLTLSQQFEIKKFQSELARMSKKELEQVVLELIKQKYGYQNLTKQLLKGEVPDGYLQQFRNNKNS